MGGDVLKVLYLDDDPLCTRAMRRQLAGRDVAVAVAHTAGEAFGLLSSETWDVVVSDFAMPLMDGVEFMRVVARRCPSARRFLLTGTPDAPKVHTALGAGIVEDVLAKPIEVWALRERLCGPARGAR